MTTQSIIEGIKDEQQYNNQNNYKAHDRVCNHVAQAWDWADKEDYESYDHFLEEYVENMDWEADGLDEAVKVISKFYEQ